MRGLAGGVRGGKLFEVGEETDGDIAGNDVRVLVLVEDVASLPKEDDAHIEDQWSV